MLATMIYTKAFCLVIFVAVVAANSIETTSESWDESPREGENTTSEYWDEYFDDIYNEIDTDYYDYDDYGFWNETNSLNDTSGILDPHENTTFEDWDDFWAENEWENLLGIEWKRPEEIARFFGYKKPLLFKDGHTRFDINQGYIGDCWFLAALALLPAYPKVFNNVLVDRNQSFENNPAGKQYKSLTGIDAKTYAFQCQGFSGSSFGNTVNGLKLSLMIIFQPLMETCCS